MNLLCKLIGHKWKNVIETAIFSPTKYFHECSRCLITKEGEISEKGFIIKYAVTEVRPKEAGYPFGLFGMISLEETILEEL